ncbi:hypothetical protein HanRHA438_Chr08g0340591 [Helianthus annuus]|nr:hypothetical protein HanRHA438_Chr08g0340591 [Helianthus annuus]
MPPFFALVWLLILSPVVPIYWFQLPNININIMDARQNGYIYIALRSYVRLIRHGLSEVVFIVQYLDGTQYIYNRTRITCIPNMKVIHVLV